jgi:Flp pilus assembly protein TadG
MTALLAVQFWTDLSGTKLIALIGVAGVVFAAAVGLVATAWGKLRDLWYGNREADRIRAVATEAAVAAARREADTAARLAQIEADHKIAEAQRKTLAEATATLIDANKTNPSTNDVDPATEARVREMADAPPTDPPPKQAAP